MNDVKKHLIVGVIFSCSLFLLTYLLYLEFTYLGAANRDIEDFVFGNFKLFLLWANLKILLVYIVIGLIMGLFTFILRIEKKKYIVLFNFFFWFMFWLRGIKMYPQMFSEQLYSRGGLLRYFQVFVTDYLPLWVIYFLFFGIIAFVALKNRRPLQGLVVICLPILFFLRFQSAPAKGANNAAPPNILVFATDSLRPDHISFNGYPRKTPFMDGLLSRGVNFLNCKSSLARTLPSYTSIFTSTFPPQHRMRHMFPSLEHLKEKENWTTLVDVLNDNGYYTAVVSDFAGDIFPTVNYGFQKVQAPPLSMMNTLRHRSYEIHYFLAGFMINPLCRTLFPEMWGMPLNKDPFFITQYAKKLIKQSVRQDKPFFILSFSSNNHFPYVTRHPYYMEYTEKGFAGKHKYHLDSELTASFFNRRVTGKERDQIVNLYDQGVKLFDDSLGEMLEFLEKSDLAKNTIVIVLSDHGENLYERYYGLAHGDHLDGPYANNMVFGIHSPHENFGGKKIENTVRDIDIAPTILDLLGIPSPSSFKGTSLLPYMRGAEFAGLPAYMETGLWYSPIMPYLEDRIRIEYPVITRLVTVDKETGWIYVKKEYDDAARRGKYKTLQLNEKKYVYMPGPGEYREVFFINENPVPREKIQDKDFLDFKQKMVDLFPGIFYIDSLGFIREK